MTENSALDVWTIEVPAGTATVGATAPPVDWPAVKAEVLARLDVAAEFRALGVEFAKPSPNAKGIIPCHALGRQDDVPSAFVNVRTGVYHDAGGEGKTTNLFDFAAAHGPYGRWIDAVRHYAEKAGVGLNGFSPGKKGRVRETVYLYRSDSGEVAYAVFRYRLPNGKKSFSQHPPDGKGGWKYGDGCMEGVPLLPYRLPELRAADPGETVWVLEGEKDCDRAAAEGLTATTGTGGSGNTDKAWPPIVEHFRDRACVVVPDNDPVGRKHALKVASYLKTVTRSVKVIDLPGVGLKGDLSDWLDQGNTVEDLGRLAFAAPEWDESEVPADEAPEADPNRDATVADLRPMQSAESWLWPNYIPSSVLSLLAAEAGTGKTRFCFDLMRRIVKGLPWPDGAPMTVPPDSRILWVAADHQWQEMCDIPTAFGIPDDLIFLNSVASDPYGGTSLETVEEVADLETRIERVNPVLVVIDTITNTGDFKSESASDAKRQYKPLQEVATRRQVPILCVTHLNAGGKVLGRRAVEKVRVVIQMECPDPDGQPHRRKLHVTKSKAIRPPALGVTMGDLGNEYDDHPPEAPVDAERFPGVEAGRVPAEVRRCMDWLAVRLAGGPDRVSGVRRDAEAEGFSSGTIYRARDKLGVLENTIDGKKWWAAPAAEGDGEGVPDRPF